MVKVTHQHRVFEEMGIFDKVQVWDTNNKLVLSGFVDRDNKDIVRSLFAKEDEPIARTFFSDSEDGAARWELERGLPDDLQLISEHFEVLTLGTLRARTAVAVWKTIEAGIQ
jgi:hypothetical protein